MGIFGVLVKFLVVLAINIITDIIIYMNEELQKKIQELFILRQNYKNFEKEVYSLLSKNCIGSFSNIIDDVDVRIDICHTYKYNKEFTDMMKKIYDRERKKTKLKETLYISFFKNI